MKILIADDEADIRLLLSDIAIGAVANAEIIQAGSRDEALKLLQTHNNFDLIVSDKNLGDGSGWTLQEWNMTKGHSVPFIISTSEETSGTPEHKAFPPYGALLKPKLVEPFLALLDRRAQELAGIAMAKAVERSVATSEAKAAVETTELPEGGSATTIPEYCRVSLESLLRANTLPCDLYIRLSEKKHVKILNSGELFGEADRHHYARKQIEHLYVHRQFLADMLNHLARNVLSLLEARGTNVDESIEIGAILHRTVQQNLIHLGVTEPVQETIRSHMSLAVRLVKGSDELKQLLKKMRVEPNAYINSHSSALAFFGGALLAMMPWRSDTGYFKLSLAGIMHDITLENHDLAQLDSLAELTQKVSEFSTAEVNSYRRHPMDCAELVRKFEKMPPDVDQMVLQHHEKPDGSGFPHKLPALRISPLSALFIVAHDLVRRMHLDENFDAKAFLLANRPEYDHGPFKRVLRDARAFINGTPSTSSTI